MFRWFRSVADSQIRSAIDDSEVALKCRLLRVAGGARLAKVNSLKYIRLTGETSEVPVRDPKKMKFDETVDTSADSFLYEPQLDFVLDSVEGARVLNIGCWTGNFESLAVGHVASMTGLDV